MKLVDNYPALLRSSHSVISQYLLLGTLGLNELIFYVLEIDTNPRFWFLVAVGLSLYGIIGRILDQTLTKTPDPYDDPAATISLSARYPWLMPVIAVIFLLLSGILAVTQAEAAPASEERFTEVAVPHIGKWEGLRLTAYKDIVGVWTVCYGETKDVRPGDTYTRAECDAMFAREVLSYRNQLHAYFAAETLAHRLPVLRDVAYTSLAYNVGVRAAGKSTATRRLNAGDIRGGCHAIGWWNKAGGRVIRGLANRRSEEVAMCLEGSA